MSYGRIFSDEEIAQRHKDFATVRGVIFRGGWGGMVREEAIETLSHVDDEQIEAAASYFEYAAEFLKSQLNTKETSNAD